MSAFRVGQRVKKIALRKEPCRIPLGTVGTIMGRDPDGDYEWLVAYDGYKPHSRPTFYADSFMLAPLTDPLAEQFIERIKKIAREPAPMIDAPRELVEYDEQIGRRA